MITSNEGRRSLALFWLSNIQGIAIDDVTNPHVAGDPAVRDLVARRETFEHLCAMFLTFLERYSVETLLYGHVFGALVHPELSPLDALDHGLNIDRFVQTTAIPSEDLEVVVAAERVGADIFVTNDGPLTRCAWSLGLNRRLSAASFCRSDDAEYEDKVRQCLTGEARSRD